MEFRLVTASACPHPSMLTPVPSPESLEEARVEALGIILIAEGADLDDELSCWRALMRNRVGAGEAMLLTPRAIYAARDRADGLSP